MKKITNYELKKIEIEILKNIADYCDNNGLRYYLCGGTLIGAIRHKGFVPWDDDIDIIMPRPDFMKFIELFNSSNKYYKVNCIFNNPKWYSTFAEVEDIRTIKTYNSFNLNEIHGVNIDIFITDGSPNNYFIRRIFWVVNNVLARILTLSHQNFTISKHYNDVDTRNANLKKYLRTAIKFIAIPFARCTRIFNLAMIINKIAMHFDINKSEYIGVSTFPHYGYRECVKAKNFLPIEKREFEGDLFNTPKNYHEYLSNLYGDYMKLPPKEKQVSHHNFIAYWKDGIE